MRTGIAGWLAPIGFAVLLAPGAQAAQPLEASASLRLSYFTSTRDLDSLQGVQAITGEWELGQEVSDAHRWDIAGRVTFYGAKGLERTRTHWRSVAWHTRMERADVRVGQQLVRWGKADGINPIDFFTPVDHTSILPLEDDRYLSVPAARVDLHVDDSRSLSMVATAGFTPSRLPWPRPSPVTVHEQLPGASQVGARWSHTGERTDWSLAAFRGHASLPLLHAQPGATPAEDSYLRHYAPIVGVGADLARSAGPYGIRAELAHTSPRDEGELQSIRSSWHLVAGVDRSFSEWNFNVQAVVHHTPGFRPIDRSASAGVQWAATQNAIVHGQQAEWVHGMTARVVADWRNDTLQTELLVVAQFDPANYVLRPLLTYAASDTVKLRAGAEYYHGPQDTYFGALEPNRTAFAEVQWYY